MLVQQNARTSGDDGIEGKRATDLTSVRSRALLCDFDLGVEFLCVHFEMT